MIRSIAPSCALVVASILAAAGSALAAPTLVAPIPDQAVLKNAPESNIPLATRFVDQGVSVVRFTIVVNGVSRTVDVALLDVSKPITTNNFKAYMNAGRFNNTIIHRSAVYSANPLIPFVLQGGGFTTPTGNNVPPGSVQTFAPIQNEPGISNRRGTIAMAKVGNQPNSATSQWFFNMNNDNATTPGFALLDTQNGGFTVFGRVIGNGMSILDSIIAFDTLNLADFYGNSSLDDIPVPGYVGGPTIRPTDFVNVTTVAPVPNAANRGVTFTVVSSNPNIVAASIVNDALRLSYAPGVFGSAFITVTATSADTTTTTDTLTATIRCSVVDIADDQGTPLPSSSVNNGITEGDYNAFFGGFFDALSYCDIADDAGNPTPPGAPNVPNNGVTEGDYNCFFSRFFEGCV
jgi:cyclophilin family peptidyl-prolyl cis-trans isomerase